jgi:DNA polymerase-1
MPCTRLVLIDGMAVLYRAFFAIPELSDAAGRPTNAVFGFIRMLKQIATQWEPTHWAVVFDGGLSEERMELLEDYKAQRPSCPDKLREQVSTAEEYLDCADIAWMRVEGEEADDVLASLAQRFADRAGEILIATGDKDLYQLVSDKCRVVPVSGKGAAMGPDQVREKTGVGPLHIVAWLALVGDTSDNIPGVPGIGPKTAARLLGEFGSLAELLGHLDRVKRAKVADALRDHREAVARNVEMVRLRDDLPLSCEWDDLEARPANPEKLLPFLDAYGFDSLAGDLRQGGLPL